MKLTRLFAGGLPVFSPWIYRLGLIALLGFRLPAQARAEAANSQVEQYTGLIGTSPIRMSIAHNGNRLTGSYRYVHSGASLHLEGIRDGNRVRLQEIYGQRSHTGTIAVALSRDGSMSGTWTKPNGGGQMSFYAHPLGTAGASRASVRQADPAEESGEPDVHVSSGAPKLKRRPLAVKPASPDSGSDFLRAVQRGDTSGARDMLDEDNRLRARDKQGRTALLLACRFRDDNSEEAVFPSLEDRVDFVKFLLAHGADPNARDNRGYTPLMYAAASWGAGNPVIRLLLDAGANVDARNIFQGTALMIATGKYGDVGTVQLLVDANADVSLHDKYDNTALSFAKSHHARASVRVLEQAGAEE